MKPYRLLEEKDDHFLVSDDGGSFKVAKGRLAHSTVNRIRQHFSEGGEVRGYSGASGRPEDQVVDRITSGDPLEDPLGVNQPIKDPFSILGVPPPPAQAPATTSGGSVQAVLPADLQAMHAPFQQPAPEQMGPQFHDVKLAGLPADTKQPPQAPPPPDPAAQIAAATGQGARALEAKGQAESEGFKNIARQQEQAATHLQAMQADSQKMLAERTAREDQIFNDVQNAKVDPGRWWASHSTGQKVSASIGLILGGIGAGLTKGPNYAVEMLNKHIDRDMEAQRVNIGKQQNLLSHYMAQTRDLVSAQHLAKADYLTGVAAQIAAASAKTSGAIALPAAQAAIAQLRVQAAAEGQQATLRSLQIKESQLGVQYRTMQIGALSQAMQQAGAPGTSGGITFHPAQEMLLPKELQETLVRLPSGKVDFARTPKDAEEVKKTTEATEILRKKLQRYGALRAAHPNGISSVLSPADHEAAQGLHESILTDLNGLAGLNRFTHEEAQVFGQRIPDITSLGRAAGRAAKLDELGQEIDDKVRASNRAYLRFSGPR